MSRVKTLALFGAGKIGRSFIAQIFVRNGYEVVFIDVDRTLIDALNQHHRYKLVTLHNNGSSEEQWIEGVRAIDGRDEAACIELLSQVSLVATSVGAGAIPAICKTVATATRARHAAGLPPFDLILAENMRDAVGVACHHLTEQGIAPDDQPGLIAASIGKTAPDIPVAESDGDPLLVHADSYNTLIVSAHGWRADTPPPSFPELKLVDSIAAYIDRKLFVHNLAHCALAYFGYQALPDAPYIHNIIEHQETRARVEKLIGIVSQALVREYPSEFTTDSMREYVSDTFGRIANPSLRDSIWRVGRDIPRKLGRNERIVGSLLLALRHGLPVDAHAELYIAALSFRARNEQNKRALQDEELFCNMLWQGISSVIYTVSKLNDTIDSERAFIEIVKGVVCSKKKIYFKEEAILYGTS